MYYLIKFIFNYSDLVIILNDTLKQDILPFIPIEKMIVIPNTLKDTKYIKNSYKSNEIKLLFCANLFPDKGIIEYIKCVIEVSKLNRFKIKAIVIGDYQTVNFFNEIKTLVKPVEQIVSFKGLVVGDEKLRIFSNSDIFIFPTYYKLETFGLVNLEAMRAGLPVISTNHAAIPNIVIDNYTGFIVPPRDINKLIEKVIILIENEKLREKFGKNGRERFLKYYNTSILEKALKKILEHY
jgi:glycosyltransferase involved in cell wall biosynthesis